MNPTPAAEYAVYYPDADSYLADPTGIVCVFPTRTMAELAADSGNYVIHMRYNTTVTPWQYAPPAMDVIGLDSLAIPANGSK